VIVEIVISADGSVESLDIYRGARPRSCEARLSQRGSVAGWQRRGPEAIAAVNGLAENLREPDGIAQRLKNLRQRASLL
jgi:hypothetical protein